MPRTTAMGCLAALVLVTTASAAQGPVAASEDHDAPASAASVRPPPVYVPTPEEQSLAPPPAGMPFMFSLLEDGHAFLSGGAASETRLRFGKSAVGFTVGVFNLEAFDLGLDFFRYAGVPVATRSESFPFDTFVLVPNIDLRGYFDGGAHAGVVAGTSLSGVRFANCALTGCFEMSLRVLTADAWYDFSAGAAAVSLGAGASVGMKL